MLPTRAAVLCLVCTVSLLSCNRREPPPREPERETATPPPPTTPQGPDSFLVAVHDQSWPSHAGRAPRLGPARRGSILRPGQGRLLRWCPLFPRSPRVRRTVRPAGRPPGWSDLVVASPPG